MEQITVTYTRRITEAVQNASRQNGAKAKSVVQSEEHRAKLRAGQQRRREREKRTQQHSEEE